MSSRQPNSRARLSTNNSLGIMMNFDANGQPVNAPVAADQQAQGQNRDNGQNGNDTTAGSHDSYVTAPLCSQSPNIQGNGNNHVQSHSYLNNTVSNGHGNTTMLGSAISMHALQVAQVHAASRALELTSSMNSGPSYGYTNNANVIQDDSSQMVIEPALPKYANAMAFLNAYIDQPASDDLKEEGPANYPERNRTPARRAEVAAFVDQFAAQNLAAAGSPCTIADGFYDANSDIEEDEDEDSDNDNADDEMEDAASDQDPDSTSDFSDPVSGESDDEEEIARAANFGTEDFSDGEDDDQGPRSLNSGTTNGSGQELLQATGIDPDEDAILASLRGEDIDEDGDRAMDFGAGNATVSSSEYHDSHRRLFNILSGQGQNQDPSIQSLIQTSQVEKPSFDFFALLSNIPELTLEFAKHLRIEDFVSLYAISKDFHEVINGHLTHVMKLCAAYNAPESSKIFLFRLYGNLCIPDPVGRTGAFSLIRQAPSLRWLTMIYHREKTVRDILACLAREGHRTPKSMSLSLKKMWLTMDIATNNRRVQLMHNTEFWTDQDLFNLQLFFIKLDMRFNDPIDGPGDDGLRRLMLGQRGLTPLKKLLKREAYFQELDMVKLAVRYAYQLPDEYEGMPVFGIPFEEIGRGHFEGWGEGKCHLYRPDELVMRESVRRNLGLDDHLMYMLLWGYVDPITKKNIAVTEEEMYMSEDSDEELKKKAIEVENELCEELAALKDLQVTGPSNVGVDSVKDVKDLPHVGDEWETEDEDMPLESMQDDLEDRAAIGPSGWRRNRASGTQQ